MTQTIDRAVRLSAVAGWVERAAEAMQLPKPDSGLVDAFLWNVLYTDQSAGGEDVWGALTAGLVSEMEARDVVGARVATWLSDINSVAEPSYDEWGTPELDAALEVAMLGRPASRHHGPSRELSNPPLQPDGASCRR
jgi:hypothetical protein